MLHPNQGVLGEELFGSGEEGGLEGVAAQVLWGEGVEGQCLICADLCGYAGRLAYLAAGQQAQDLLHLNNVHCLLNTHLNLVC